MADLKRLKVFCDGDLSGFSPCISDKTARDFELLPDSFEYTVFPGFCDVHVHFREPGFSYKETISTGCAAAAHGGYTAVCTMPNLAPVPDDVKHLKVQTDIIEEEASVNVYPYGAITYGETGEELSDMDALAPLVIAFSDDGRGVQSDGMMVEAMEKAASLGKIIAAHCEVDSMLRGGYIHAGRYAAEHRHPGICSESEWHQVERDLKIAEITGCAYHVCHISCRESVELIREAKKSGVDVTCETAPHYLVLADDELADDGRFKMNPPIKTGADREALLEALADGTIDMIATDHAPHSQEEKSKGFQGSAYGIVGLETAFPVLYTKLVKEGVLTMAQLIELLTDRPNNRFQIKSNMPDEEDPAPTFTVWDLDSLYRIDSAQFLSKGKSTPFNGWTVQGRCMMTVMNGEIVYRRNE